MNSRKDWREAIHHFTWAWHTVIMGTGSVSILAHLFPYGQGGLGFKVLTLIFFFLNLFLFVIISAATVARYVMFPDVWSAMLSHSTQSLFIGTFPMGAATLINVSLVINQNWGFAGKEFLYTLWAFWWLDCLVSYLCVFGMLYVMMSRQNHSLNSMAMVWLLPIVTLVVASSTGGLLAQALETHSRQMAIITTAFSLTMVVIGLSLALMVITVYLVRLIIHGPPDSKLVLSAFIVLGPLGQGGYSLLINGQNVANLFPLHLGQQVTAPGLMGQMIDAVCIAAAYALWSMGIAWIIIALCSVLHIIVQEKRIPFSMAYWGVIFPNGVYAMLCIQLGEVLDSSFHRVLGAIYSVIVLLLWIVVFVRTIPAVIDRSIFSAPCVPPSVFPTKSRFEADLTDQHQPDRDLPPVDDERMKYP